MSKGNDKSRTIAADGSFLSGGLVWREGLTTRRRRLVAIVLALPKAAADAPKETIND